MSVMQKLLEINDELVKVLEERDRLQAQLAEVKNQLEAVVQERYNLQTELNTKDKQLQDVCSVKPAEQNGLVRDVSHYLQTMTIETTTESQATDYTPPDGWRLLEFDEEVDIPGRDQYVIEVRRYIRPIEPQPVQVREGRWKTRGGAEVSVSAMPTDHDDFSPEYPWWDGYVTTWANDGVFFSDQTTANDLVEYLGPIESEPEQEFKPYTFAAYIVGDKSQPDALRIVWATEEWIQHANFGIVHRMSGLKFFGNDTFTPDQFSVNLKVQ
jgi:hypothetical protein